MYVFLDESGIHLKTGHSVFALVYIEAQNLQVVAEAATQLEAEIAPSTFHWKDMSWKTRAKAFWVIKTLPFQFQIAVVNNPIKDTNTLAEQALGRLLATSDREINAIYIDGRKSHAYEGRLKKALREARVKAQKLRTVNDHAYAGIQIADSIAGLYRHQLDKPSPESARLQRSIAAKQI